MATAKHTPKPSVKLVTITPTMAKRYLATNVDNRKIRPSVVNRYASDMKEGRWQVTGDSIVFNTEGHLIQGQHRLTACVESNTSFQTFVMRNASPGAYTVMDTGEKRTLADLLDHRGETQTMALAAAIHLGWRWDNGQIRGTLQPSRSQALQWLDENPGIRDALLLPVRVFDLMPRSQAAILAYRFRQVDAEAADHFFESWATGADLAEGNPILALRNWCLARTREAKQAGHRTRQAGRTPALAVAVKAWNGYITGNEIRLLKWRGHAESFPQILTEDGTPFLFPEVKAKAAAAAAAKAAKATAK